MQFSEEVKATLWSLIDEMTLDLGRFTVNPDTDFKRKRKWNFQTLIKFIISMEGQSLKNELHKYFGYTTDCPTNASFNQRRAQIKSEAFQYLFQKFTATYNTKSNFYKGYRIGQVGNNVGDKVGNNQNVLNQTRQAILSEMRNNPNLTKVELSRILGISTTAIDDKHNKTKEDIKTNFSHIIEMIDIDKLWQENESKLLSIISNREYDEALKICCLEHGEIISGLGNTIKYLIIVKLQKE